MHHLDLIRIGERHLDELRDDADHRRLLRLIRRSQPSTTDAIDV